MAVIIETTVYQLEELSDSAKEQARAWYQSVGFDYDWYDTVYEDFVQITGMLGIELRTREVKLMGGGTRQKPCICFRGFWSQGDGACFEGHYAYRRGAPAKIRGWAPLDATLHGIADRLQAIQWRNFYQLHAGIRHRGHYYHEYCMDIDVGRDSPADQPMTDDAEDEVTEALRDLARWLYRQLEREYDYLSSDEAVDEAIIANGYTFTEDGERFG